jgi:hypothetical protein
MFAADRPVMGIGIGPTRMPVGLPRIGDRVHHERVDVGNRQAMPGERVADRLLALFEQPGGPGVRNVRQDFDAGIAKLGNLGDGFLNGKVQVGVGAEGELHGEGSAARKGGGSSGQTPTERLGESQQAVGF